MCRLGIPDERARGCQIGVVSMENKRQLSLLRTSCIDIKHLYIGGQDSRNEQVDGSIYTIVKTEEHVKYGRSTTSIPRV